MLIYIYLFALIVGGVLLGASIVLGGQSDADADADADLDVDADADLDLDADADADLDLDADADADLDLDADADADGGFDKGGFDKGGLDKDLGAGGSHGGFEGLLLAFLSLRFWVFFLAFFGMTGLALQGLGLVQSNLLGLLLAVGMGMGTGYGAVTTIRKLSGNAVSSSARSNEYVGKSARVVVPLAEGGVGKVRVRVRGTEVDLLAESDEPISKKDEVLIVEMDGTRARVARLDD